MTSLSRTDWTSRINPESASYFLRKFKVDKPIKLSMSWLSYSGYKPPSFSAVKSDMKEAKWIHKIIFFPQRLYKTALATLELHEALSFGSLWETTQKIVVFCLDYLFKVIKDICTIVKGFKSFFPQIKGSLWIIGGLGTTLGFVGSGRKLYLSACKIYTYYQLSDKEKKAADEKGIYSKSLYVWLNLASAIASVARYSLDMIGLLFSVTFPPVGMLLLTTTRCTIDTVNCLWESSCKREEERPSGYANPMYVSHEMIYHP